MERRHIPSLIARPGSRLRACLSGFAGSFGKVAYPAGFKRRWCGSARRTRTR
jgi:hypothetical protein